MKQVLISDTERQRRKEQMEFARASIGLERFTWSKEVELIVQDYIDGKMSFDDCFRLSRATLNDKKNED